jgi:hypothetical protein
MKILFYTLGYYAGLDDSIKADYQSDFLFMGLRELFGSDVVDLPRKDYLYKDFGDTSNLGGKGFSYAKTLDDPGMERNGWLINGFDIIVLSVHHSIHNHPYPLYTTLQQLIENEFKGKVVVVDGNDHRTTYLDCFNYKLDLYLYKRELLDDMDERVLPISFAIPADRVLTEVPKKKRLLASIIPADFGTINRLTHSYDSEADYYEGYQSSWFGLNSEKGGFDSARIREIAMNGCIPIFSNIEQCPARTLCDLPKKELMAVKDIHGLILKQRVFTKHDIQKDSVLFSDDININELQHWAQFFLEYARNHFTTGALAKRVLNQIC